MSYERTSNSDFFVLFCFNLCNVFKYSVNSLRPTFSPFFYSKPFNLLAKPPKREGESCSIAKVAIDIATKPLD